MRLAELLTYVIAWVRIVEMSDTEGESVELYWGRYDEVPVELLKREISFISGSEKRCIRICLMREE